MKGIAPTCRVSAPHAHTVMHACNTTNVHSAQCRHSSGSIAKVTRRMNSQSEGQSTDMAAAANLLNVPQSDALIDGFTVPEVGHCY